MMYRELSVPDQPKDSWLLWWHLLFWNSLSFVVFQMWLKLKHTRHWKSISFEFHRRAYLFSKGSISFLSFPKYSSTGFSNHSIAWLAYKVQRMMLLMSHQKSLQWFGLHSSLLGQPSWKCNNTQAGGLYGLLPAHPKYGKCNMFLNSVGRCCKRTCYVYVSQFFDQIEPCF